MELEKFFEGSEFGLDFLANADHLSRVFLEDITPFPGELNVWRSKMVIFLQTEP